MALSKKTEIYWFQIDKYVKIDYCSFKEIWTDSIGKYFTAEVAVKYFTNSTKEYEITNEPNTYFQIQSLRQDELNLSSLYEKLKELPEFEWFISC